MPREHRRGNRSAELARRVGTALALHSPQYINLSGAMPTPSDLSTWTPRRHSGREAEMRLPHRGPFSREAIAI